ncbi:hypothetical protein EDEG_00473 [Edhazardia aedis USNM 41457]|uniref:DUF2415 domain-containing protein n=1 Tax=Edhazardia aedis (strain USNM 41457) TaxID=1003232 RepID=J8ZNT1_EDHAE|nr:hypothetical protein EDEG_00473 [Edhazardia aedis USNM 41457]|eukprot:EJW01348.1 hypothetical protein EDEG_00473 [Edhazardia aedis USNM 41457]
MKLKEREVNILQYLDYPTHINDIKLTQEVLISTGAYKPALKIHLLDELSLKNERCMENEAVKIEPLTKDGLKLVLLRSDRYIDVHAKYGYHTSFRLPCYGREMQFNPIDAELMVNGNKGLFRFNFDEGRFVTELVKYNVDTFKWSPVHGLTALANEKNVYFCDYRAQKEIAMLDSQSDIVGIDFTPNGINFAFVSETGDAFYYDLRKKEPIKNYSIKPTVKSLKFNNTFLCMADDEKLCIFDTEFGHKNEEKYLQIIIENIKTFEFDCGLFFIITDDGCEVKTYFCKDIGGAPTWCKFLEAEENFGDLSSKKIDENIKSTSK